MVGRTDIVYIELMDAQRVVHSALKMGYSMEEIAAAVKDLNRVDWLDDRKESWKESLPVALLDTQTASMLATYLEEGEVADLEIEMG